MYKIFIFDIELPNEYSDFQTAYNDGIELSMNEYDCDIHVKEKGNIIISFRNGSIVG